MRPQELPDFHPQTVLRDWGNGQAFRLSDAQTGVCVFGATGSGKTSGPAKHLAYGYLAAGFGGLVLCAKKEERRQWQQWAAETGREDDLVIIEAGGKRFFNFLEWEASRPEEGGGLTINIVALLDEIAGAIAHSAGKAEGGHGNDKFWQDALHHMNANLVDLPLFAPAPRDLFCCAIRSRLAQPDKLDKGDYLGNCGGKLIRDLLQFFGSQGVFDPMTSSGTCADVCRELGVPCLSRGIHQGFDATDADYFHSLPAGSMFDFVWVHPPYWPQKIYTDDPRDLSRTATLAAFLERYAAFIANCAGVLSPSGKFAILMGDYCDREARFVPLNVPHPADCLRCRTPPVLRRHYPL
jgi:hypothetical protein